MSSASNSMFVRIALCQAIRSVGSSPAVYISSMPDGEENFALLAAFLNVKIPLLLGDLVKFLSNIVVNGSKTIKYRDFRLIGIRLFIVFIAQTVCTFLYIALLTMCSERIAADLGIALFEKISQQDVSFYDVQRAGELCNCLSSDVQEFKSCFKLVIAQGLRLIAQTAGSIVALYIISPKMTFVTIFLLPIAVELVSVYGSLLRALSRDAQIESGRAVAIADEAFSNIRTVGAFTMKELGTQHRAVVLLSGGILVSKNELDAGGLMSFLSTAQNIQRSLGQISIVYGLATKGIASGSRGFEFMNLTPEIPLKGGSKIPLHSLLGQIEFQQVSFSYSSRRDYEVLDHLNLTITSGEICELCGPSGEGKSTLIALLERFYEPTSGRILLGGKDITNLDPNWLRGTVIGLISQEPVLFATTIEENIKFGKSMATFEEICNAARIALADDFISDFPDGYKTVIGERGTTLSGGGQKQRIAIARAVLKDPHILVLDEATCALDAKSERKQGTHEELLHRRGLYYQLNRSQYTER